MAKRCLLMISPPPVSDTPTSSAMCFAEELMTASMELDLQSRQKSLIRMICVRAPTAMPDNVHRRRNVSELVKTMLERRKPEALPTLLGNYAVQLRLDGTACLLRAVSEQCCSQWMMVMLRNHPFTVTYAFLQHLPDNSFREYFVDLKHNMVAVAHYVDVWSIAQLRTTAGQKLVNNFVFRFSCNFHDCEASVFDCHQINSLPELHEQLRVVALDRPTGNRNITALKEIKGCDQMTELLNTSPSRVLFVVTNFGGDASVSMRKLYDELGSAFIQQHLDKLGLLVWRSDVFHFGNLWKAAIEQKMGKAAELVSFKNGTAERAVNLSYLFMGKTTPELYKMHNKTLDEEQLLTSLMQAFCFYRVVLVTSMADERIRHSWVFEKQQCFEYRLNDTSDAMDESGYVYEDSDSDF